MMVERDLRLAGQLSVEAISLVEHLVLIKI